jgi:OOP family OmpA-OmpF porin
MRTLRIGGVVAAVMLLGGCEMWTYDLIDLREAGEGTGSAFTRALQREYLDLANYEADVEFDWQDSDEWAEKGLMAAAGNAPEPELSENWQRSTEDMDPARERMMRLFARNATDKFPGLSAWAQVQYDCWLEEQDEAWQTDRIETCRSNFMNALAFIEEGMKAKPAPMVMAEPAPPAPQPMSFIIFFDFDSAAITPEAARILDDVAAAYKAGGRASVALVGHTDRAGSNAYNVRLSQRRVDAAKGGLAQRGVPANAVSGTARGESQPRVPTPDGVREQENRRVEIELR